MIRYKDWKLKTRKRNNKNINSQVRKKESWKGKLRNYSSNLWNQNFWKEW